MEISKKLKSAFRKKGLSISDEPDFPDGHVAYPNGYIVIKPASVGGNSVPEYESWFDEGGIEKLSDAPAVNIFVEVGKYFAEVSDGLGGKAPGDFKKEFDTEEELGIFVTNYFFGETYEFQSRINS